MANVERFAISFWNESHMFFIYDHRRKKEEDDPKDAILYFYPASVETDDQIALVGGLIGLTDFCLEFLPQAMPQSVKLLGHNFAMLQTEDYILSLSGSRDIPDKFLLAHMQFLWSTFVFYQGSISAIKQRAAEGEFLKQLNFVWDMYLPMCQSQGDILGQSFQILPYVQFQKSQGNLFLHASHILQRSIKQRGVVAGALFNKNKILCTQLSNTLTRKLLLLMLNSQSPGVEVNCILELPGGVRLMYVYMTQEDYQSLGHRRRTAFSVRDSSNSTNGKSRQKRPSPSSPLADNEVFAQSKPSEEPSEIPDNSGAGGLQEIFQSHLTRVDSDLSYRGASHLSSQTHFSSSSLPQNSGTDSEVFLDTISDYKNLSKDRGDKENSLVSVNNSTDINPSAQGGQNENENSSHQSEDDGCHRANNDREEGIHVKEAQITTATVQIQEAKRDCVENGEDEQSAGLEPGPFKDSQQIKVIHANQIDEDSIKIGEPPASNCEYPSSSSQTMADISTNTADFASDLLAHLSDCGKRYAVNIRENYFDEEEVLETVERRGVENQISPTISTDRPAKPTSLSLKILQTSEKEAGHGQYNDDSLQREELIKNLYQHNQEIDESLEVKQNNSGDDSSTHSSSESRLTGNNYEYDRMGSLPSLAISDLARSKDRLVFDRNDSENSDPGVLSPMSEFSHPYSLGETGEKSEKCVPCVKASGTQVKEGNVFRERNFGNSGSFDMPDTETENSPPEEPSVWLPRDHGLEELTLYIQGHSDTLLVLLLDKGTVCDKDYIHSLWKSCLSHLAELDFEVKNAERFQKDENEHPGSCYNYMHYDSFTQNLTGSAVFPVTNLGSEMVDACVRMHEDFVNMPNLQDCIYRSHSSACFGCHSIGGEVYFQIGAQGPSGGNIYWVGDKTFYLNSIAKGLLKKDHNISFY